ncbi:hypothetical protein GOV04_02130 [Candidatus Woesearchaeota archaeon]|nr:hypothetical protein [Candidatus Woesearchaeota archaeon]
MKCRVPAPWEAIATNFPVDTLCFVGSSFPNMSSFARIVEVVEDDSSKLIVNILSWPDCSLSTGKKVASDLLLVTTKAKREWINDFLTHQLEYKVIARDNAEAIKEFFAELKEHGDDFWRHARYYWVEYPYLTGRGRTYVVKAIGQFPGKDMKIASTLVVSTGQVREADEEAEAARPYLNGEIYKLDIVQLETLALDFASACKAAANIEKFLGREKA